MAKEIYNRVAKLTPTPDRGLRKNQSFYEIRHTKAACAYVEVDFHDNKAGASWILANIENIAREIAEGILTAAGIVTAAQLGIVKTVTASSLRVRQSPSLLGKQIGSLPRGTAGWRIRKAGFSSGLNITGLDLNVDGDYDIYIKFQLVRKTTSSAYPYIRLNNITGGPAMLVGSATWNADYIPLTADVGNLKYFVCFSHIRMFLFDGKAAITCITTISGTNDKSTLTSYYKSLSAYESGTHVNITALGMGATGSNNNIQIRSGVSFKAYRRH